MFITGVLTFSKFETNNSLSPNKPILAVVSTFRYNQQNKTQAPLLKRTRG